MDEARSSSTSRYIDPVEKITGVPWAVFQSTKKRIDEELAKEAARLKNLARLRRYYLLHLEKRKAYFKEYYLKNREARLLYNKIYREKNREKIALYRKKRKARRRKNHDRV